MTNSPAPLALLLLAAACNLSDKYCIGNCPEAVPGDETTSPGDPGSETTAGRSDTGSETDDIGESVADGSGEPDPTTDTGVPDDPPPTCELADTIPVAPTCGDDVIEPGELCFNGSATLGSLPGGLSSAIAVPLDGVGTDILAAGQDHGLTALLYPAGDGVAALPKPWPQTYPEGDVHLTAVGDFNEDGFADVAVYLENDIGTGIPVVFLLDGEGGLLAGRNLGGVATWAGASPYDLDGDDHPDLLLPVVPDRMRVLTGDGTGDFVFSQEFTHTLVDRLHVTGALGPDGRRDDIVFAADAAIEVQSISPAGWFTQTIALGPTDVVHAMHVADLQGDGLGDIVALIEDTKTNTSEVAVIIQSPPSGPTPEFATTRYTVHCGAVALAFGDLDGDGVLDLATAGPSGNAGSLVTLRRNDGDGGFADIIAAAAFHAIDELFIVDLNSDGAVELWTGSRADGSFGLVLNFP